MDPTELAATGQPDPDAKRLLERAAEIVRDGKLVPPTFDGMILARFAAAWELGFDWRVPFDVKVRWDDAMLRWGERGGDVDWWSESDRRLERPAPLTSDPWARAWAQADTDAETASGYKPTPGLPARFARLWSARTDHYRDLHPAEEDPTLRMAALNDLCRDGSEIGLHARRVRAQWLRREERRGKRPDGRQRVGASA